jgi:hypothetical protein
MAHLDAELISDNDSGQPAKDLDSKRPAKNKPIGLDKGRCLTRAAKVVQAAEQHQKAEEESSSDDFQADADDPDYVDEHSSAIAVVQRDVFKETIGADAVDAADDDFSQLIFQSRIPNQNQTDNVINPRLPKLKVKYETISIYNFGTNKQAPRRQAYLIFERLFPNSSFNPNPKLWIRPLQIPSTELVDGFLCKNIGSLIMNGLKIWSHSEVPVSDYSSYKKEAKRCGIKLRIHKGQSSPTSINEDPYQFVLDNGINHKDMIEDLDFEKLADDLSFPSPGSIPVLNSS